MKLLLVDATNAIMRRAMGVKGITPEVAAADAADRIERAAGDIGATHLLAVFDDPETNWRYDLFPDYKHAITNPGQSTVEWARAMWKELRKRDICCVVTKNYEADDTIATISTLAYAHKLDVAILSSDNDLLQLLEMVGVAVYQYAPKGESPWLVKRDIEYTLSKFGVLPADLPDYQALVGGKNGVPGVPKVGAKTAAALIGEHGNLEAIFAAGALPEEFKDRAVWARSLHRLCTTAPVDREATRKCRYHAQ